MVIYSNCADSDALEKRNGSIGEVVRQCHGLGDKAYDVRWISGEMAKYGTYGAWTKNLDLLYLKYNPQQTGDREDDI